MKQYAFKRKEEDKVNSFYAKLLITTVIFCVVTIICNLNQNFKEPIKEILYSSYDFQQIKIQTEFYLDKCKEFVVDIKNSVYREE